MSPALQPAAIPALPPVQCPVCGAMVRPALFRNGYNACAFCVRDGRVWNTCRACGERKPASQFRTPQARCDACRTAGRVYRGLNHKTLLKDTRHPSNRQPPEYFRNAETMTDRQWVTWLQSRAGCTPAEVASFREQWGRRS